MTDVQAFSKVLTRVTTVERIHSTATQLTMRCFERVRLDQAALF